MSTHACAQEALDDEGCRGRIDEFKAVIVQIARAELTVVSRSGGEQRTHQSNMEKRVRTSKKANMSASLSDAQMAGVLANCCRPCAIVHRRKSEMPLIRTVATSSANRVAAAYKADNNGRLRSIQREKKNVGKMTYFFLGGQFGEPMAHEIVHRCHANDAIHFKSIAHIREKMRRGGSNCAWPWRLRTCACRRMPASIA